MEMDDRIRIDKLPQPVTRPGRPPRGAGHLPRRAGRASMTAVGERRLRPVPLA